MTQTHTSSAIKSHILGFPRVGKQRELKFAQEKFWKGESDLASLQAVGKALRAEHWQAQLDANLDFVTVGDFAWYDQVLNTLALLGGIPTRFGFDPKNLTLEQYFALARGILEKDNETCDHGCTHQDHDVKTASKGQFAMEMTKWFDTNYHYLVPEWTNDTSFNGGTTWLYDEVREAQALAAPSQKQVKVVLVGPLTLLKLGKAKSAQLNPLSLLPNLIIAYQRVLVELKNLGVEWVQIDEPILATEIEQEWQNAFVPTYTALAQQAPNILLATYFESVSEYSHIISKLPVAGLHIDLVRGADQLESISNVWDSTKVLSLGVIDGRNIWRTDLSKALATLQIARETNNNIWVAPSCSLLHVPFSTSFEVKLDAEIKSWLAYATEKLQEVALLTQGLRKGAVSIQTALNASDEVVKSRQTSTRIHNTNVKKRVAEITEATATRLAPFATRIAAQQARLKLPAFPTTTIGSFPQTAGIRQLRRQFKAGEISHIQYLEGMRAEIKLSVDKQAQYGIDMYVHGEAERNDMVEYFGEQLWGYAFTQNGWVQSYGSRCVKPPIIYGDVYRPEAMTVEWSAYAQSLTDKPMKGMLTGPITMLQWSFVRDDQPRSTTALQIALALRDEVVDLEKAGIAAIQIDEPAIREGLPLKKSQWDAYLTWAVQAFKVSAAGVQNNTQIHTHMCYSEFNDILPAIAALDADVITIETSRSDMELLDAFGDFNYPNDIGPGVYDIHSPRIPQTSEMVRLMEKAAKVVPVERLWVNPDCGLKTRQWDEVDASLTRMVEAAKILREKFATKTLQPQQ